MALSSVNRRNNISDVTVHTPDANTAQNTTPTGVSFGPSYQPGQSNLATFSSGDAVFHLPPALEETKGPGTHGNAGAFVLTDRNRDQMQQQMQQQRRATQAQLRAQLFALRSRHTPEQIRALEQEILQLASQSGRPLPAQVPRQSMYEESSSDDSSHWEFENKGVPRHSLTDAGVGDIKVPDPGDNNYGDPAMPVAQQELTFEGMVAFIDSLGTTGLTKEQLSAMALPTFDPATFSDQTWGIIKAGATAYGTSFMVGKLLVNYLALAGTDAGVVGWALFPVAGVLNEIVSAPLAGAIRANHGTYASPDGAASANYHTANARLLAARISGDTTEITRCRNDLDSIVKGAIASAKTRAAPGDKLWAQWDEHPIASATLRSWLTDDLPFTSFIAMYVAPGGTAAMLKDALDNKAAFAALDGLAFAASGATAGILTVLGQNLGRISLQHAQKPSQGTETELVRDRHVDQAVEMIGEIDENVAVLQGHRKQLEAQIKGGDNRREVKDLRDRIVHMISVLSQKEISQEDRIRGLQSGIGRTRLTATTAFGGNVLGEPVNPPATAFLDGAPMQRRTAATVLGNAAALATMTLYMANYVLPLAAQALAVTDPDDAIGFNATEFNSTLANATLTDSMHNGGGFNSVLVGATSGCVLIGSWLMRRAIATGAEYALAMGEGLRRRLVQKKPVEAQQPEDAGILLERRV